MKKATFFSAAALALAVTSFMILVAVTYTAINKINIQAAHVVERGYINTEPQKGLALAAYYWALVGVVILAVLALLLRAVGNIVAKQTTPPHLSFSEQHRIQRWGKRLRAA